MTAVCRFFVLFFLVCGMVVVVVGCAPRQAEVPAAAKRLEDIESTVPKLSGLPLKNAQTALSLLGLKVGEVTLYDTNDSNLHGQVFEQNPAPGTGVKGGTAVNVKVYRYAPGAEEGSSAEEK